MIGSSHISYSVYLVTVLEIHNLLYSVFFFCVFLLSLPLSTLFLFSNLYSDICVNVVYFFSIIFSLLVFAYFVGSFRWPLAAGIRCEKVCF